MSRGQAELNEAYASLTESLIGDYDLADLLHRITEYCIILGVADGAGLVIADSRGSLRDLAYSDEGVRQLGSAQLSWNEGPCVECVREGRAVGETDLTGAGTRWPRFAPHARLAGYTSVRALPLRVRQATVGVLSLFSSAPLSPTPDALSAAQIFADLAILAVLQDQAPGRRTVAERITRALQSRSAIERAKGMLAEAGGLDMDEAFSGIRRHAHETGRGLTEVAQALLLGSVDVHVLASQAHGHG
ncbi:GAF and ANTAR domain-containing protein [Kitasatospora sp. GAS204B]|uniref:GAF and ANTAR domain-containing protein n=1 Tax=unclassified Kitasatospora TaxID=2633591 RepID=UPI0024749913|nr:GAF and ANTAR domain-containing protein [Kitasatospora sp. GAS204B]MDH6119769.1 hypothetical protein [Kitasatospora sp. GAS204B]